MNYSNNKSSFSKEKRGILSSFFPSLASSDHSSTRSEALLKIQTLNQITDRQSLMIQSVHTILMNPSFQRAASVAKLPPKAIPTPFGVKMAFLEGRVKQILVLPTLQIKHKRHELKEKKISKQQALQLLNIPEEKKNDFPFIEAQYNQIMQMISPEITFGASPMQKMVQNMITKIEAAYEALKVEH